MTSVIERSREMRSMVLDVHLGFADMAPFVALSRRVAVNAEVAAAKLGSAGRPYAAVVQELHVMARGLSELIHHITSSFKSLTVAMAEWGEIELRFLMYARTLARMESRPQGEPLEELFQLGSLRRWAKAAALTEESETVDLIRRKILEEAAQIVVTIARLERDTRRLGRDIDSMRHTAARHSKFIAVTALIEKTRVPAGDQVLGAVSADIRDLADRISEAGGRAHQSIEPVLDGLQALLAPIFSEIETARHIGSST